MLYELAVAFARYNVAGVVNRAQFIAPALTAALSARDVEVTDLAAVALLA